MTVNVKQYCYFYLRLVPRSLLAYPRNLLSRIFCLTACAIGPRQYCKLSELVCDKGLFVFTLSITTTALMLTSDP